MSYQVTPARPLRLSVGTKLHIAMGGQRTIRNPDLFYCVGPPQEKGRLTPRVKRAGDRGQRGEAAGAIARAVTFSAGALGSGTLDIKRTAHYS